MSANQHAYTLYSQVRAAETQSSRTQAQLQEKESQLTICEAQQHDQTLRIQ